MSYHAVLTCPHCSVKKMAFDVLCSARTRDNFTKSFCQCRNCKDVVVITRTGKLDPKSAGNLLALGVEILSVFPEPSEPSAPAHTPGHVAKPFIDGLIALSVDLIGPASNSFRTTLEKATSYLLKDLGSGPLGLTKSSLFDRIEFLNKNHLITPSLYEWAHVIRDLGNAGTHSDPDFSKDQANDLRNFTEQFLIYVFTIPAQVKRSRGHEIEK